MKISSKKIILFLILLTPFFKSEVTSAQKKDVVAFIPFSKSGELEKLAEERLYNLVTTVFINAQRFKVLEMNNISVATNCRNYPTNADSIHRAIAKYGLLNGAKIIIIGFLSNVTTTQDDKKNWSASISVDLKYVNVETGICDFALSLLSGTMILPNSKSPEEAINKAFKNIEPNVGKWIKEKFPLERPISGFEEDAENKVYNVVVDGGTDVGFKKMNQNLYLIEKECETNGEKRTTCRYLNSSTIKLTFVRADNEKLVARIKDRLVWERMKVLWESTPERDRSKRFLIVESVGK